MRFSSAHFPFPLYCMAAALLASAALAQTPVPIVSVDAPAKSLGMVIVTSGQPTSLPTPIPTTIEGVTREQIEQSINATDSEDALKYLPSLLVRKRYIGDYNHAILSSRATGLVSYRLAPSWTGTFAARYSGKQFSSLDSSDVNGSAYQGASKYFVTDVRVLYKAGKQWTAAFGIDNLNNYAYWNFHPYPQRTFVAELRVDL